VLGTEFAECLAFYASAKNLVTYLTVELGETNIDAARNVSTWIGSCYLTPLIGAFLADTYWGRYKTMIVFLLLYTVVSCTKKNSNSSTIFDAQQYSIMELRSPLSGDAHSDSFGMPPVDIGTDPSQHTGGLWMP
jgi:hypothetical protein